MLGFGKKKRGNMALRTLDMISLVLVLVGGLNWGLDALGINPLELLLPNMLVMIIYGLVGVSAVWFIVRWLWMAIQG